MKLLFYKEIMPLITWTSRFVSCFIFTLSFCISMEIYWHRRHFFIWENWNVTHKPSSTDFNPNRFVFGEIALGFDSVVWSVFMRRIKHPTVDSRQLGNKSMTVDAAATATAVTHFERPNYFENLFFFTFLRFIYWLC